MIRHGQASFFAEDYDRLSAQGKKQARHLGRYWLAERQDFDEVFCGPRNRHIDTASLVGEMFSRADRPWPQIVARDELDEHQVDQLVRDHADTLAREKEHLATLFQRFERAAEPEDQQRHFQRLFEAVTATWLQGDSYPVESWTQFQSRVNDMLEEILATPERGRRIAFFTSVGPISIALQRALECHDRVAMQTGWRIWNCSLTEFVFSQGRLTLDRFNALPHLPREDWTYR